MFVKNNMGKKFNLAKGISSNILGHGGKLMLVENHFEKGVAAPIHSHKNEQVAYIAKGKFELTIGEETQILEVGDSFYVEANVPHGCIAIEEGIVVDIFMPQREDFLEKAHE